MSTSQDRVILAQFRDCPLALLEGLLNYVYLTDFNSYLNACISEIFTNGGCSMLGYLVLTAPPATFLLLCNDQFIVPANPWPIVSDPNWTSDGSGSCRAQNKIHQGDTIVQGVLRHRKGLPSGQVSRIKYVTMHVSTVIYVNTKIKQFRKSARTNNQIQTNNL